MRRVMMLLLITAVVVLATAGVAAAAPALDGSFDVSGTPDRLTLGPDGNVWFTLQTSTSGTKQFGKIAPDGTVTEYPSPDAVQMVGITAGPDHNLWATEINKVVRIDPSNPAGATSFPDNDIGGPQDITTGPDGHLWTGSGSNVVEITPSTPAPTFKLHSGLVAAARGIATGGDGNLWIDDFNAANSAVVKFATSGASIQSTIVGGGPQGITAGPPGQLAFTNPLASPQEIGRIDYAGNVAPTLVPNGTDPFGIAFANDGAYWTAEFGANALGRLTPTGDYTQPILFGSGSGPRRITTGAGDTLWVGLETAGKVARITGVSPPTPPPPPPVQVVPPVITPAIPLPIPFVFPGAQPRSGVSRVSGRVTTILISCPGGLTGKCVGTVVLRTASLVFAPKATVTSARQKPGRKKTHLKLGSTKFSIAAGATAKVKITLSSAALKLLSKTHSLKALASVTTTAGNQTRTTTATVSLKLPNKKKR